MPRVDFMPNRDRDEEGRLMLAAIGQMNQMMMEGERAALENQLLQKQIGLFDEQVNTDLALKQLQIQSGQFALEQSKKLAPLNEQSARADLKLKRTNAKFAPKIAQSQLSTQEMARELTKLQIQTEGVNNKVAQATMQPRIDLMTQQIEAQKASIASTMQQIEESRKRISTLDQGRLDKQAADMVALWPSMNAEQKGMARAAFRGTILDHMPEDIKPANLQSHLMQLAGDDTKPENVRRNAMTALAYLEAGRAGINVGVDPGVAAAAMAMGQPIPESPVQSLFRGIEFPGAKAASAQSTSSSAPATNPSFEYKETGIKDVDNQLYHLSQRTSLNSMKVGEALKAKGGTQRALNDMPVKVRRSGSEFLFESKDMKKLGDLYGKPTYRRGDIGGSETVPEDAQAVLSAMFVDKDATMQQQATYEAFLKNVLFEDLGTATGLKNFDTASEKILSLYPTAFTPVQAAALTKLRNHFAE